MTSPPATFLRQASTHTARTKGSIFEIVYRRSVSRLGHNQAIGAIAHRLCRLIWLILHQGVRYEERGPAATKRSKQLRTWRMIRQLRRLGYRIEPPNPPPSQAVIFDPGVPPAFSFLNGSQDPPCDPHFIPVQPAPVIGPPRQRLCSDGLSEKWTIGIRCPPREVRPNAKARARKRHTAGSRAHPTMVGRSGAMPTLQAGPTYKRRGSPARTFPSARP